LGQGRRAGGAGDDVGWPVGEARARQLINGAGGALSYLCMSTMREPDITVYPDSNKVGMFAGAAPGGDKQRRALNAFFKRDAAVDYWLDES